MNSLPSPQEIERVARDVLREYTAAPQAPAQEGRCDRHLISQGEVRDAKKRGETTLIVAPEAIVTPLARDLAWDLGIEIRRHAGRRPSSQRGPSGQGGRSSQAELSPREEGGTIALGADHGGFRLKEALKSHLNRRGLRTSDLGTHSSESCDYPDLAGAVAKSVSTGAASWGILVDGAGLGSCMAANKVPGVLAATCHDERTAKNSREHNGANVLCLGSGTLDETAALRVVDAWLGTAFGGGRHERRVDKIRALERSFLK